MTGQNIVALVLAMALGSWVGHFIGAWRNDNALQRSYRRGYEDGWQAQRVRGWRDPADTTRWP